MDRGGDFGVAGIGDGRFWVTAEVQMGETSSPKLLALDLDLISAEGAPIER